MRQDKNVEIARAAKGAHKPSYSLLATSRKDVTIHKLDKLFEVVLGIVDCGLCIVDCGLWVVGCGLWVEISA